MKKVFFSFITALAAASLALGGVAAWLTGTMPDYDPLLGNDSYNEKIQGEWLVEAAAKAPETLTIYGSSELRTQNISTHPANFFSENNFGFQINLVGRGSCQSLIHALSIAASGAALRGTKVALITSPQSFIAGGITPDMFMANFSEQQYLDILADKNIPEDIKARFSVRISELMGEYSVVTGKTSHELSAAALSAKYFDNPAMSALLAPYSAATLALAGLKDMAYVRKLIESTELSAPESAALITEIDWGKAEIDAASTAERLTDNNDFGILNDYYTTYIGRKLEQQKNKDVLLSYSVSEEYDDLRLLFDVCKAVGVEPLFIHVPLHGDWSDFTGFTAEKRTEYYENVRKIVNEYGIKMLDLSRFEYEKYFLCDIMHLGWKGWLEVDKALVGFYYER